MDLILQSLPPSFNTFVVNFNIHKMETSLVELVNMLKIAESTMKSTNQSCLLDLLPTQKLLNTRRGRERVPRRLIR